MVSVLTRVGFVSQKLFCPTPSLAGCVAVASGWPRAILGAEMGVRWAKAAKKGWDSFKRKNTKKPRPQAETKCIF